MTFSLRPTGHESCTLQTTELNVVAIDTPPVFISPDSHKPLHMAIFTSWTMAGQQSDCIQSRPALYEISFRKLEMITMMSNSILLQKGGYHF